MRGFGWKVLIEVLRFIAEKGILKASGRKSPGRSYRRRDTLQSVFGSLLVMRRNHVISIILISIILNVLLMLQWLELCHYHKLHLKLSNSI